MYNETTARASAPSLDRGTKSPTAAELAQINAQLQILANEERAERVEYPAPAPAPKYDPATAGRWVRLACDNWRAIQVNPETGARFTPLQPERAQWRATLITQVQSKPEPPRQHGDRWTERLSPNGRKAIENASHYSHRMGRGFRTFATLTLNAAARARLEHWDSHRHEYTDPEFIGPLWGERRSLGNLAAEFVNHLQMTYKRGLILPPHWRRNGKKKTAGGYSATGTAWAGRVSSEPGAAWTPITWTGAQRIQGHKGPLVFVWVAECPNNEAGERNPHIHLMMNWSVRKTQFHAWAKWLEANAWKRGFVNLTKLKAPGSAAAYMAKAARYLAKGSEGAQGAIRGNRYSVSREARAPAARHLGTFYADWLRDAVALLYEAGRDRLPRGLWATKHSLGATTAGAWRTFWQTIKRDGFRFDPAPPDLHYTSLENTTEREAAGHAERIREWVAEKVSYCHDNWRSLLRSPVPMIEDEPQWIH